jgi:hypothetical protein
LFKLFIHQDNFCIETTELYLKGKVSLTGIKYRVITVMGLKLLIT